MNCLRGMLLLLIGVGLHTLMPRMYALALDDLQFRWEKNGDVFIANGSQLVLNCTNTNASAPYADVSKLKILKASVNVSAIYQHIFWEDRTVQLHIPKAQISDSATYVCMDGVNIPKLKMVKIGVEPSLPENITCISENFQNLVCSFNKPSTTYIPVRWYMEYSFDGNDWSQVNKINCKSEAYTCTWPPIDSPDHKEGHREEFWEKATKEANLTQLINPKPSYHFTKGTQKIGGTPLRDTRQGNHAHCLWSRSLHSSLTHENDTMLME